MTAVVREALEHERQRTPQLTEAERAARLERLMEIARRSAAKPEPYLADDDLYDEMGLPK